MTLDHFSRFVRNIVGDRHSTKEVEQIYRNLVTNKPLTFKRFTKIFQ
jgi:hypothetical protein